MREKRISIAILALFLAGFPIFAFGLSDSSTESQGRLNLTADQSRFTGSVSCRKCHEKFYQLWAPSHHGLAMRPHTNDLAGRELTPQAHEITIGNSRYRADISQNAGYVIERRPDGEKKYPIEHVLGGKNVYYFLTTLDRGRLQTLPVADDVRKKEWFDMAASGVIVQLELFAEPAG